VRKTKSLPGSPKGCRGNAVLSCLDDLALGLGARQEAAEQERQERCVGEVGGGPAVKRSYSLEELQRRDTRGLTGSA